MSQEISKPVQQAFHWVWNCIDSCTVKTHIDMSIVLVQFFCKLYPYDLYPEQNQRIWEILRNRANHLNIEVPYNLPANYVPY